MAQCASCASAACTSELAACLPDPTCTSFAQCWTGTCDDGDADCIDACAASYPGALTDAVLACLETECSNECYPTPPVATAFRNVLQITRNNAQDIAPAISGWNVAWEQQVVSDDLEIYLWNGAEITQLTDNDVLDEDPDIDGSKVVWAQWDGSDREIMLWDGVTITQVTDNTIEDFEPVISGSNVAWYAYDGSDHEIYFWDGATTTQVTDNATQDRGPAIFGSTVVWLSTDGLGAESVQRWDGSQISAVTTEAGLYQSPKVSDAGVVWTGCTKGGGSACTAGDFEIYFWNGVGTTRITDNSFDDLDPAIDGNTIVCRGPLEIYVWGGSVVTQITNTNIPAKGAPDISGPRVVWSEPTLGDFEIFLTPGPGTTPALSLPGTLLAGGLVGLTGWLGARRTRARGYGRPERREAKGQRVA